KNTEAETNPELDVWLEMYNQLAIDYPQLNLLTGEDLQAYNEAAEVISTYSEYSYSDLNTALPSDILGWYANALLENNDDEQAAVESIVPQITQARDAYIERRTERENRSEEHTSELQSRFDLVCRLLLE